MKDDALRIVLIMNKVLGELYVRIDELQARAERTESSERLLRDRLISKCDGDIMAGT